MAYKSRKDIKVPESYIQKIRDTKTKSAALAKYGDSTDPKMREALRRFYGDVNAPKPIGDSARAKASTLPRKSVAMKTVAQSKPSRTGIAPVGKKTVSQSKPGPSVAKRLDSAARSVYRNAGPANFIAGGVAVKAGMAATKAVSKTAKAVTIAKNTKTLKTAKGSEANLARMKVGRAKGLATKSEVKQAKAAVNKKRGMR